MDAVEKAYLKELLESLDMFLKPGDNGYNLICDINTDTVFARVGDGSFRIPDEVPEEIRYPLQELIQCAYDFSRQFESAEGMARYGVEGYRRIGEYCSTVFAAKLLQSGSMELWGRKGGCCEWGLFQPSGDRQKKVSDTVRGNAAGSCHTGRGAA